MKIGCRVWLARGLVLCLLLGVVLMAIYGRSVLADNPDSGAAESGKKHLVIEVVEDIPAVEIEDDEVPLAAAPVSSGQNSLRHPLMMGCLLTAVAAYVIYFSRYDRKLARLRRQAAEAEYNAMKKH
ncbi:MAG: hypothetical protein IJ860_06865 [Eubacterium sp.]|nr:hypothetical protein [Eubacterium sp.]